MENREGFYWERHPEVEALFLRYLDAYRGENSFLADFEKKLVLQTSSGILNWIDHILAPDSKEIREKLSGLGFKQLEDTGARAFYHPGVLLPMIVLAETSAGRGPGVALRVESIESFLQANGLKSDIEGPALGPYRRALFHARQGSALWAVERRGTRSVDPVFPEDGYFQSYGQGIADWKSRPREDEDEEKNWECISRLAGDLVAKLGIGTAAHIVCRCERDYWLSRNNAGRVQKRRQDALGVGWANHDHHTFRSSRRHFSKLIGLFLELGFHKRERFYAGREAGWGAQVMENSAAGLTLFLDVDLAPEEVNIDFSTRNLQDRETLGTVGLWCALHGDSFFKAGMHHLAARYDFERLASDIVKQDVRFMAPFSNFPYLKQAFSIAETWQVDPSRIRELLHDKRINDEQAEKFLDRGSVGSHLENIERRDGYKGFNKENVSAIILETDPRKG